jgi:hypothetical protein
MGWPNRIASFALLRCAVLEASFCARPRYTEPELYARFVR